MHESAGVRGESRAMKKGWSQLVLWPEKQETQKKRENVLYRQLGGGVRENPPIDKISEKRREVLLLLMGPRGSSVGFREKGRPRGQSRTPGCEPSQGGKKENGQQGERSFGGGGGVRHIGTTMGGVGRDTSGFEGKRRNSYRGEGEQTGIDGG